MPKVRKYGEVTKPNDIKTINQGIRSKIKLVKGCKIHSKICDTNRRDSLMKLYRQAGYLITLTYSPGWKQSFKGQVGKMRSVAKDEFKKTVDLINRKAKGIGIKPNFDAKWGQKGR